ncbi:hypothetical protein BY996DRAFT_6548461, partial [Phakopsora pachyrhizi]
IMEARELSLNTSLIDETLNQTIGGKKQKFETHQVDNKAQESHWVYGIQEAEAHLKTTLKRNQAFKGRTEEIEMKLMTNELLEFKTEFEQLNKENRKKTKEECIIEF